MEKSSTLPETSKPLALVEYDSDETTTTINFARLYKETVTQVFNYLYSRIQNIKDTEDLTSQTFLSAYENIDKLQNPNKFTSWVFSIARNKVVDFFRRSQRDPIVGFNEELDQTLVHKRQLSRCDKDTLLDLAHLIAHLKPREQEYLRLRIAAELPFSEIAALLNMPETRLKKRYYRLLARIQAEMEE